MSVTIREMEPGDWPAVERIYEAGLATRLATFETASPGWEQWNQAHLSICRFIAIENHHVLGWVALSPVSDRCVYGGVAEVSIYIDPQQGGKGLGKQLMQAVIQASEKENIWTLQSSMFAENLPSIGLHKKCGFREIGFREKIGKLDGRWRDTLIMERRSQNIL